MAFSKITNDGVNGLSIASNGRVTMANTTQIDMWRLTANFSTNSATVTGWEQPDHATHANAGTSMSESSGIFTFPNTGLWKVSAVLFFNGASGDTSYGCILQISTDTGSSFSPIADAYEAQNAQGHASLMDLINVTNASTFQLKLVTAGFNSGTNLAGETNRNRTTLIFERITDSQ